MYGIAEIDITNELLFRSTIQSLPPPLMWTIHDRFNNKRTKYLHGRYLRLIKAMKTLRRKNYWKRMVSLYS